MRPAPRLKDAAIGAPLLDVDLLQQLYAHARVGYPREVCGLIFADRAAIGYPNPVAQRCENHQDALHAADPSAFPRDARTAYALGADDLLRLARSLETMRPARIVYHSHVEVGAYFSSEDARAAAPQGELLYPCDHLVIDVRRDRVQCARLYRFDRGSFVEVACF